MTCFDADRPFSSGLAGDGDILPHPCVTYFNLRNTTLWHKLTAIFALCNRPPTMPVDPKIFNDFTVLRGLRSQSAASLAQKAEIRKASGGAYLSRAHQPSGDTLFLLSGQVLLEDSFGRPGLHLVAGDALSRDALHTTDPGRWSARCLGTVTYLAIDSALLEVMQDWNLGGSVQVEELSRDTPQAEGDWMMRLLQKWTFQRLPPANLQALFQRMQPIAIEAGETLIRQGDPGDTFYVLVEGRCQVWHEAPAQPPLLLATFTPGECFGEESLLSGAPRSATVKSETPVQLLRLSNEDFSDLLKRPMLQRLSYAAALDRIASGAARWLDVRMPNEILSPAPDESISIPAHLLRYKVQDLPRDSAYICICENGRRSAVASFVLNQAGLDAFVLEDGLAAIR